MADGLTVVREEGHDGALAHARDEVADGLGHHGGEARGGELLVEVLDRDERMRDFRCLLVAQPRFLRERLEDDRVELAHEARAQMARRHWHAHDVVAHEDGGVRAHEWRLSDQHLVEDQTQAVHVRRRGRGLAFDTLGSDVHRGGEELRRVRVLLRRARDAEVGDLRVVVRVEQDVRRLEVSVDDALPVRERETVRDLGGLCHRIERRERSAALDALLERPAGKVLHDDERQAIDLADVVHRDDARVGERGERARFLDEHLAEDRIRSRGGIQDLDRDLAVEHGVLREVDLG